MSDFFHISMQGIISDLPLLLSKKTSPKSLKKEKKPWNFQDFAKYLYLILIYL